jgi:hypothetical protein
MTVRPSASALAPRIFISYRRSELESVRPMVQALRDAGAEVFIDVEQIDPLSNFPARLRAAVADSHAVVVWWSKDYTESNFCLDELRISWQYARKQHVDAFRRVWIINPHDTATHVIAGDLAQSSYIQAPQASGWRLPADDLVGRARKLIPDGVLGTERSQTHLGLWNVARPVAHFVGRGRELWAIHTALNSASIGEQLQPVAVHTHGLGGVGKTQLALRYANDFASAYPGGVYWLSLAGHEAGLGSIEAAERVWLQELKRCLTGHPWSEDKRVVFDDTTSASAIRSTLRHLLNGQDSLWIVDNFPTIRPDDLREHVIRVFTELGPAARSLITTRDARQVSGVAAVPLEVMSEEDSIALLAKFRRIDEPELDAARRLAREVGGHALALSLLGYRLRNARGGYQQILASLEETGKLERIEELAKWAQTELGVGSAARGIVTTFRQSIKDLPPVAMHALVIASLLAPNEPIPQELFYRHYETLAADFKGDDAAAAISNLEDRNLLSRRGRVGDEAGLAIHPLTSEAARWLISADWPELVRMVSTLLIDTTDPEHHDSSTHIHHLLQIADPETRARLLLHFAPIRDSFQHFISLDDFREWIEVIEEDLSSQNPYVTMLWNAWAESLAGAIAHQIYLAPQSDPNLQYMASEAVRADERVLESLGALPKEHHLRLVGMLNLAGSLKLQWTRTCDTDLLSRAVHLEEELARESISSPTFNLYLQRALLTTYYCLGDFARATRALEVLRMNVDGLRTEEIDAIASVLATATSSGSPTFGEMGPYVVRFTRSCEHPTTLLHLSQLADARGRRDEARALAERAIARAIPVFINNDRMWFKGSPNRYVGNTFCIVDHGEEQMPYARQRNVVTVNEDDVINTLTALAIQARVHGATAAAGRACGAIFELDRESLGLSDTRTIQALKQWMTALRENGQGEDADRLEQEAREMEARAGGVDGGNA